MRDKLGREIVPGCTLAYAVKSSRYNCCELYLYRVIGVNDGFVTADNLDVPGKRPSRLTETEMRSLVVRRCG